MALRALFAAAALILITFAGQNVVQTQANNSDTTISSCPPDATGAREGCTPASPDSDPGTVLGHEVLTDGCVNGDLHVLRYLPNTAATPVVATWCS